MQYSQFGESPHSGSTPNLVISQYQSNQTNQQIQEDETKPSGIVYLRKLYFLMAIQFAIAIVLNLLQISAIQKILGGSSTVYILGIVLLGLSMLACASTFEQQPFNAILFAIFTALLYIFFASLTVKLNLEQSLMVQFIIGGQVFGQLISVLQARVELHFHQQSLYVFASALIVFQLFIIYTKIPFYEMAITLVSGVIFGFLLVYVTQIKDMLHYTEDSLAGSVRVYFDIGQAFFLVNYLLGDSFCSQRKSF